MSRGRHQYYDPILQEPLPGDAPDLSRIELFPVGQESEGRLMDQPIGKWMARKIGNDGRVLEHSPGDFDHDNALRQAQEMWPGLQIYQLNSELEDSTWNGVGPSPRMWQTAVVASSVVRDIKADLTPASESELGTPPTLNAITVSGTYVRLDDVLAILEDYAVQFDGQNNPSAAMGLREAAAALREPF